MDAKNMQLLPGVRVGHATNEQAATGCTVVVVPTGAVAGVDVRGGAPGTRETDLLNPLNTVEHIHAVLLTGGSAFGLDAASGVMHYLEEQNIGFETAFARVPIVVGAVLYDLGIGSASVRPDADMGYAACQQVTTDLPQTGCVGAGTGVTVGKLGGPARATKSGIGYARERWGNVTIEALVAVNAVGEVVDEAGRVIAGVRSDEPGRYFRSMDLLRQSVASAVDQPKLSTNTTIGCLWTNARLTKAQASKVAQMAHDGLARAIVPIHTPHDGDTLFTLSVGEETADLTLLGALAAEVCTAAVRDAVRSSQGLAGVPSSEEWARQSGLQNRE